MLECFEDLVLTLPPSTTLSPHFAPFSLRVCVAIDVWHVVCHCNDPKRRLPTPLHFVERDSALKALRKNTIARERVHDHDRVCSSCKRQDNVRHEIVQLSFSLAFLFVSDEGRLNATPTHSWIVRLVGPFVVSWTRLFPVIV